MLHAENSAVDAVDGARHGKRRYDAYIYSGPDSAVAVRYNYFICYALSSSLHILYAAALMVELMRDIQGKYVVFQRQSHRAVWYQN